MGGLGPDDFKTEAGRMKHMLRSMPDSLGDDIREARLPDGRRLVNDPRFFRWASKRMSERAYGPRRTGSSRSNGP